MGAYYVALEVLGWAGCGNTHPVLVSFMSMWYKLELFGKRDSVEKTVHKFGL